jgi:hypothetical protein
MNTRRVYNYLDDEMADLGIHILFPSLLLVFKYLDLTYNISL